MRCEYCGAVMAHDEARSVAGGEVKTCLCGAEWHSEALFFGEDPWRSPDYLKGVRVGMERGRQEILQAELVKVEEARREIWQEGHDTGKEEAEKRAEREAERVRPHVSQIWRTAYEEGHRVGVEEIHQIKVGLREEVLREVVRGLHSAGLRQVDIANALGTSQPSISRMLARAQVGPEVE